MINWFLDFFCKMFVLGHRENILNNSNGYCMYEHSTTHSYCNIVENDNPLELYTIKKNNKTKIWIYKFYWFTKWNKIETGPLVRKLDIQTFATYLLSLTGGVWPYLGKLLSEQFLFYKMVQKKILEQYFEVCV